MGFVGRGGGSTELIALAYDIYGVHGFKTSERNSLIYKWMRNYDKFQCNPNSLTTSQTGDTVTLSDVYSTLTLVGLSGAVTSVGLSCTVTIADIFGTVTFSDLSGTVVALIWRLSIVICVTTSWQHEYVTFLYSIQTNIFDCCCAQQSVETYDWLRASVLRSNRSYRTVSCIGPGTVWARRVVQNTVA